MANRLRKNHIHIMLSDEEKEKVMEKMKLTKCKSMRQFILKCVLEEQIFEVDMQPFRDLQFLLSNATNNLNQIAKKINSTSEYNRADIQPVKEDVRRFSKELIIIQRMMLRLQTKKK